MLKEMGGARGRPLYSLLKESASKIHELLSALQNCDKVTVPGISDPTFYFINNWDFGLMSDNPQLPKSSDFPPGTEFVIKEFDVPLARIPGSGWSNWFGGTPQPYDPSFLRVDNNWPAASFEEWVGIVAASMSLPR